MEQLKSDMRDTRRFLKWVLVVLLLILPLVVYAVSESHSAARDSSETNKIAKRVTSADASRAQVIIVAKLLSSDCRTRYLIAKPTLTDTVENYVMKCLEDELKDVPLLPTTSSVPIPTRRP
jgi:hypothetical protein